MQKYYNNENDNDNSNDNDSNIVSVYVAECHVWPKNYPIIT